MVEAPRPLVPDALSATAATMAGMSTPELLQNVRSSAVVVASSTSLGTSAKVTTRRLLLLEPAELDLAIAVVDDRGLGEAQVSERRRVRQVRRQDRRRGQRHDERGDRGRGEEAGDRRADEPESTSPAPAVRGAATAASIDLAPGDDARHVGHADASRPRRDMDGHMPRWCDALAVPPLSARSVPGYRSVTTPSERDQPVVRERRARVPRYRP